MPYPTGFRIATSSSRTPIVSPETDQQGADYLVITNLDGTNAVDLGDDLVTANNGFKLAANASVTLWLHPGQTLYAIAEAGTPSLSVLANIR